MNVKKFPKVTIFIIFIFLVLFILDLLVFKGTLLKLGSSKGFNAINKTEWYRFLTGSFFHGNILHLIANIFGVYFVGVILENKIGSLNFLIIYLISNIFESLIWSKVFADSLFNYGASPGIYALIGCLLIVYLNNIDLIKPHFNTWSLNYIIWYFFLGNIIGAGGLMAHSLGFTFGIVISMVFFLKNKLLL